MEAHVSHQTFNETLGDWRWRLNNLYWIADKEGRRVRFQMNWAQEALFNEMHHLNVILKARQLGFTTFIQLFIARCLRFQIKHPSRYNRASPRRCSGDFPR